MNIRQQNYKKYRLEGYSQFASAIKAGYSRNTAINAGKNIESRCNFKELLEVEGLNDKVLVKHAMDGLNAPSWSVRHRYFETVLKLRQLLKTEGIEINLSQHQHFVKVYLPEQDKNGLETTTKARGILTTPLL